MNWINIHCHNKGNGLSILNRFPGDLIQKDSFYSLGIHPWYANQSIDKENFYNTCREQNVIFIGECGIDRLKGVEIEKQTEAFLFQVKIANDLNKPIIIHNVRAEFEIMMQLKKNLKHNRVVFHGVRQKISTLNKILDAGYFLSFGAGIMLSENNASDLKEIPLNRLFLETDDSQFTIEEIYLKAAEIKKITVEALLNQIQINFNTITNK